MDLDEIWVKSLIQIKNEIASSVGYKIYIKEAVPVSFDGRVFKLAVQMTLNKTMIECRYKQCIESVLSRVVGTTVTLEVIVHSNPASLKTAEQASTIVHQQKNEDSVNPKYTFDNYVIGSSNEYAAQAGMLVAENPGHNRYNPLFLYGNSGLGKTHLMHAIGNKILEHSPDLKIVYVSSEKFTNEFINSIGNNRMDEFRKMYRHTDVLLIDDVQFLEGKEQTQEEFFHTFNELYNNNKQIVLTSDRNPKNLVTLEDRLRNRFEQGLIVDITIPSYETRVAILQKKAMLQNTEVSEDILQYIAKRVKSNVRELEGALTKVISEVEIRHLPMTVETAQEALSKILSDDGIIKITSSTIIEKVCLYYNITRENLLGKAKTKNFALPRQVAMYLCKKLTDMNYVEIARDIGNKDRSTVMHNVAKIESDIEKNEQLRDDINYIIKDLQSL